MLSSKPRNLVSNCRGGLAGVPKVYRGATLASKPKETRGLGRSQGPSSFGGMAVAAGDCVADDVVGLFRLRGEGPARSSTRPPTCTGQWDLRACFTLQRSLPPLNNELFKFQPKALFSSLRQRVSSSALSSDAAVELSIYLPTSQCPSASPGSTRSPAKAKACALLSPVIMLA